MFSFGKKILLTIEIIDRKNRMKKIVDIHGRNEFINRWIESQLYVYECECANIYF